MATAINFNWACKAKMTEDKIYNFTFIPYESDAKQLEIMRNDKYVLIREEGAPRWEKRVEIFRDAMRVRDAIAIAIAEPGTLKSGEVYKCDCLLHINEDYATNCIYREIHQPSTHFDANLPKKESTYYLGFELETVNRTGNTRVTAYNIASNIWREVSDASIGSGIEFVSTLIHPDDAIKPSFYEDFFEMLTGLCKSKTDSSTGLHCHISREAYGDTEEEQKENIAKAIYLEKYVLNQDNLIQVYGRTNGGRYCDVNSDPARIGEHYNALKEYAPRLIDSIKGAFVQSLMRADKTRSGHDYGCDRYHVINITNRSTIEYRQGKGNISSNAIAIIAQYVVTVARYVRVTPWSKISEESFKRFIPSTNKFSLLKRAFSDEVE